MIENIRKLEIGCGTLPHEGYEHNDARVLDHIEYFGRAEELNFPDGTFDEIFGTGIFEHFTYYQAADFLKKAVKWLKLGGFLDINVPDMDKWIIHIVKKDRDEKWIDAVLYGWRFFDYDEHFSWWTQTMMENACIAAGFSRTDVYQKWAYSGETDWHICLKAYKE